MSFDLKAKYLEYFTDISKDLVDEQSILEMHVISIGKQFKRFGLTNEQISNALTAVYTTSIEATNQNAVHAALELLKMDEELLLKKSQRHLVDRQKQGYDDNMLLKIVEHQAGLASFAVNSGSDDAQGAIDVLLEKMDAVEARVCNITCKLESEHKYISTTVGVEVSDTIDYSEDDFVINPNNAYFTVASDMAQYGRVNITEQSTGTFTYFPDANVIGDDYFSIGIQGIKTYIDDTDPQNPITEEKAEIRYVKIHVSITESEEA